MRLSGYTPFLCEAGVEVERGCGSLFIVEHSTNPVVCPFCEHDSIRPVYEMQDLSLELQAGDSA